MPRWRLNQTCFDALAGWVDDDHAAALAAFARHSEKPGHETYRTGRIGLSPNGLLARADHASRTDAKADPRAFFERHFIPVRLVSEDGARGKLTGYYEPVVRAQRHRDAVYATPLLRRPADLVAIGDEDRPEGLDPSYRFARRCPDGRLAEYHDRAAIDAGVLDGQGLEIAYLADPVDAFFIHVQGAARLDFGDGRSARVTYDGKTGQPFTPIGRLLVERGALSLQEATMDGIRHWLASHPDQAAALMAENRSYIFFREAGPSGTEDGPVAAAKIPLTAHRSLAVDRLIHTFGTPVFVHADDVEGAPMARLLIAQDTGSAIVGPTRGDIFLGSGDAAGQIAGAVNSACDFTVLVPRDMADRLPGEVAA